MPNFSLPLDRFGHPVQALEPAGTANLTIGGSSVREALPSGTEVVRVAATGNCYLAFGDETVVAVNTDMLVPAGVEVFKVPAGATHVAIIQQGASTGTCNFTKVG